MSNNEKKESTGLEQEKKTISPILENEKEKENDTQAEKTPPISKTEESKQEKKPDEQTSLNMRVNDLEKSNQSLVENEKKLRSTIDDLHDKLNTRPSTEEQKKDSKPDFKIKSISPL